MNMWADETFPPIIIECAQKSLENFVHFPKAEKLNLGFAIVAGI